MPWCTNSLCKRTLAKEEVQVHPESNQIVCSDCIVKPLIKSEPPTLELVRARTDNPEEWGYEFSLNNQDGLKASISYQHMTLEVRASADGIKKLVEGL